LSDPQLRAHYNKYGKDKELAPEGGFTDPQEFFQQMFGGDAFRGKINEF
jgi:DnaJ-class molecular chaperone